ncbi:DUF2789 domain-containing protein [Luteimonas composti]|uniref:DUF2789 domain-containing protein n=1 Tax=Luteimonas composti TaxID=398257 RepID=A0ABT6MVU7_9GAMM|nr:DUF2789 domain-containing protein [Luteimonas composti]MDH7454406.1 DUF2789 domain-containing protein [Luteimonas composti]
MDETSPTMTHLFEQLGLDAGPEAIAGFIGAHQLPGEVHVHEAPFWNAGQRQFLAESIGADAKWAIVVDQLNESLHADAVRHQTGF